LVIRARTIFSACAHNAADLPTVIGKINELITALRR
jgi:hypothetical protein